MDTALPVSPVPARQVWRSARWLRLHALIVAGTHFAWIASAVAMWVWIDSDAAATAFTVSLLILGLLGAPWSLAFANPLLLMMMGTWSPLLPLITVMVPSLLNLALHAWVVWARRLRSDDVR